MDDACHRDARAQYVSPRLSRRRSTGAATELDPAELYRRLRSAGQQHGPAFQGIDGLSVYDGGVARATVRLPSPAKQGARRFLLHPVMVDIALQALGASKAATDLAAEDSDEPAVILPVRLAGVRVYGDVTEGVTRDRLARALPRGRTDSSARWCSPEPTGRCCWRSTKSKWRCSRHPGRPRSSPAACSHWTGNRWISTRPTAAVEALFLVGDAATADPLLNTLRVGLTARIAHCEVMSARDIAEFRDALSRKDIPWSGIVVVCPPRSVDEALTGYRATGPGAVAHAAGRRHRQDGDADRRPQQPAAVDRHPRRPAARSRVIESPWRRPNFVASHGC